MNCIEFTVLKAFTSEFKLRSHGSFENEALENEDRRTNNPNLENEAPESGGGGGCVHTSKGPQNPSQGFIRANQLFN